MSYLILLTISASLVLLFISVLETTFISTNISYVSTLKKKKRNHANILKKLKTNMESSLFAIIVLHRAFIAVFSIAIGLFAQTVFSEFSTNLILLLSIGATIVLSCFLKGLAKAIAKTYWKELILYCTYIIYYLTVVTKPLFFISKILTIKNDSKKGVDSSITREALLSSTVLSEEEGVIGDFESDTIKNTLALKNIKVKDILTPRSVMYTIQKNTKIKDLLEEERTFKFSRVPVYDKTVDNIIGVVLTKKIFKKAIKDPETTIESIMLPIFTLNENVPVSKALSIFIKKREHMFLILDNYDQTEGILTLEDCIETLLGLEIMDESDTVADMRKLAQKFKKKKSKIKNKEPKKEESQKKEEIEKNEDIASSNVQILNLKENSKN